MASLRELFYLNSQVVYLNHGSFGACPKSVMETYQNWQIELERQPVEFMARRFGYLMREAREALASFLSTGAENLLYVPNATTGLNIVIRSLALKTGDEILTTDHEYGTLNKLWEIICHEKNVRYVRQPLPLPVESDAQVVEAIWSGVTGRTRVLFLSHITSPTALILPVEELAKRAREAGIITIIDGAHAPGQIPLNPDTLGADFYAGNCHKWMMAPKGAAFLYARPNMQPLIKPLVVSWDNMSNAESRFIRENEFQGTRDISAYLSVPAAIRFMEKYNWAEIKDSCHDLVCRARRGIRELTGEPFICPEDQKWFRQMAAHPLPPVNGELLQQRLYNEHAIEIPVMECNGRQYIRISVQGYNTEADVEALFTALAKLLPEMIQRKRSGG